MAAPTSRPTPQLAQRGAELDRDGLVFDGDRAGWPPRPARTLTMGVTMPSFSPLSTLRDASQPHRDALVVDDLRAQRGVRRCQRGAEEAGQPPGDVVNSIPAATAPRGATERGRPMPSSRTGRAESARRSRRFTRAASAKSRSPASPRR